MRKILLAIVSLAAALACVAGGTGAREGSAAAGESVAQTQGQSQPAPAKPSDAGKVEVKEIKEDGLKSLLGAGAARDRPLLVNFWATWCEPCREEFPDLLRIKAQYPSDRLDFVIVSLDDASDIAKAVPEFLAQTRATSLPAYLLNAADQEAAINLVDPTWSGELPATFLYDRAGKVVFTHKGRIKPDELRAAIEQTLSAKPQQVGAQQ